MVNLFVLFLQRLVAQCHRLVQALLALDSLVARNVLIALDVGSDGEKDGSLVSFHHTDVAIRGRRVSAFRLNGHTSHKTHLAFQTFVLRRYA